MPGRSGNVQPEAPQVQQNQQQAPQVQMTQQLPGQQMTMAEPGAVTADLEQDNQVQQFAGNNLGFNHQPKKMAQQHQPWNPAYVNPQGVDPYGLAPIPGGYNLGLQAQDFQFGQYMTNNTQLMQGLDLQASAMPMYQPLTQQSIQGYYQMSVIDPGQYEGPVDNRGWRFGNAKCRWENGDYYEGDWKDNLRHGNGKYSEKGFTYIGQWQMDLKHGRGKMMCNNGDIMIGTWKKDLTNGLFSIQTSEGGEKEMVIFKKGLRINLSYQATCKDKTYYIISAILMTMFYVGILSGLSMRRAVPGFPLCIVIIPYLIYGCCTDSCSYLKNLTEIPKVFENISHAIKNPPSVGFSIECYHMETKTEHYTDSKGNKKSREVRHKKVTYTGSETFNSKNFVDQSPPPKVLHYLNMLKLARLETEKIVLFSNKAQNRYSNQFRSFVNRNKNRDKQYSTSEYSTIEGHQENCLVYNPAKGSTPWFTSWPLVIFLDIFSLGWIQRMKLDTSVFKINYTLQKLIIK